MVTGHWGYLMIGPCDMFIWCTKYSSGRLKSGQWCELEKTTTTWKLSCAFGSGFSHLVFLSCLAIGALILGLHVVRQCDAFALGICVAREAAFPLWEYDKVSLLSLEQSVPRERSRFYLGDQHCVAMPSYFLGRPHCFFIFSRIKTPISNAIPSSMIHFVDLASS